MAQEAPEGRAVATGDHAAFADPRQRARTKNERRSPRGRPERKPLHLGPGRGNRCSQPRRQARAQPRGARERLRTTKDTEAAKKEKEKKRESWKFKSKR